jgi:hypothetical protein
MSLLQRPRYHQSAINTFLKCGKSYEFRYILGLKTPPKSYHTVGKAVDESVNVNMVRKKAGEIVALEELRAVAADYFEKERPEVEWDPEEKPDTEKDIAVRLASLHAQRVAPAIEPETVQEEFVLQTDAGYDIGGTLDLTDKAGRIRDTKTASRQSAGRHVVERAFQPAVYDFAYKALRGKESTGFVFDVLVKPSKTLPEEVRPIEGKVTALDHEFIFQGIDAVHKSIQAGAFPPAPEGSWWCSPDYCGYWNRCKGRKS